MSQPEITASHACNFDAAFLFAIALFVKKSEGAFSDFISEQDLVAALLDSCNKIHSAFWNAPAIELLKNEPGEMKTSCALELAAEVVLLDLLNKSTTKTSETHYSRYAVAHRFIAGFENFMVETFTPKSYVAVITAP